MAQTDSCRQLAEKMKDQILHKIQYSESTDDPEYQLRELFNEVGDCDDDYVLIDDFLVFLESLGLTFTHQQWLQVSREIDKDFSGGVSYIMQ